MFTELPDTSIADTSTEELNTSQGSHGDSEHEDKGERDKEAEPDQEKQSEEVAAAAEEPAKEAMQVRNETIAGFVVYDGWKSCLHQVEKLHTFCFVLLSCGAH